jgi:hypothetical protein
MAQTAFSGRFLKGAALSPGKKYRPEVAPGAAGPCGKTVGRNASESTHDPPRSGVDVATKGHHKMPAARKE